MGVVTMTVPLVGELDISLPPDVVPTDAEVALAKVGVRFTVAPYSGLAEEVVIVDFITFTMVVAVLVASSFDVAVMVTLPVPAGAVQSPPAVIPPALADQLRPLVAPPVAVALKSWVAGFTLSVGAIGVIALTTTAVGVTVIELSRYPAALVTRSQ